MHNEKKTSNKANKVPQFAAACAASMGGFNTGICLGWSSGGMMLIWDMRGENSIIDPWIVSILNLGASISLLLAAAMINRIGRKWTMVMNLPLFVATWFIIATVKNDINYIVMRFVMGMSTGCYTLVSPVYVGEIAQTQLRGTLGVTYQLFTTLGILFTYCVSLIESWLWFNLINILPLIIFQTWITFMPESPYYLQAKGRSEAAKKSLQLLRGENYDITSEYKDIVTYVNRHDTMNMNMKVLREHKALSRAMGLGLLLMTCQQLSGINAVIFNMEDIFDSASAGNVVLSSEKQTIIVGAVQVVVTVIAVVTVDLFGRRKLMMLSMLIMCFFHVVLFIVFFIKTREDNDTISKIAWLPIICVTGFIVGFSLGAGPIPWCMLGEIFSQDTKRISVTVAAIYYWVWTTFVHESSGVISFPFVRLEYNSFFIHFNVTESIFESSSSRPVTRSGRAPGRTDQRPLPHSPTDRSSSPTDCL